MPTRIGIVTDTAGGSFGGGAGRFHTQLEQYLADSNRSDIQPLGIGRRVTARWLIEREWNARNAAKKVAANNVCFTLFGGERWLLLRNANHFLSPREWQRTGSLHPTGFRGQVRIVRAAAARADVIVVPSTSMAERVAAILPSLQNRVVVRFHPLSLPGRITHRQGEEPDVILCPIVDSPYKRLASYLLQLRVALGQRTDIRVVSTTDPAGLPAELLGDSRFQFIGAVGQEVISGMYSRTLAIFYPTEIESFGYPLAEARVLGLPVIAQDNTHNREVGARALLPFVDGDADSLSNAVKEAGSATIQPDPEPFEPKSYFDWLLA